jgi:cell division protein FtsB
MIVLEIAHAALTRHRGRIAILMLVLVWGYFLIAFGEQAWRARELQEDVDGQQAAIAVLATENAALQAQADRYATDAYLDYAQAIARRDLNLANPGETVLLVRWEAGQAQADTLDVSSDTDTGQRPNWQRWLDLFPGD